MSDQSNHPEPDVSAERPVSDHWVWVGSHRPAVPRVLVERMTSDWAETPLDPARHPSIERFAERRARLAELVPGRTLVIPSGGLKVRANDTDYRFRPGTDLFYLSGCTEPDAVLVIGRDGAARLYVPERRDARSHAFFTDARYGELWVGARRGTREAAHYYGVATAPLEDLAKDLATLSGTPVATRRGLDATLEALLEPGEDDAVLAAVLSEMRLVKDADEIAHLREAIAATVRGFDDVVRALPSARGLSERVIEGVFALRARLEGNDVGYNTIAASGAHATILHWTENDGVLRPGELLLLDAGVEGRGLYTADVTRTLPISGTFSPAQRRVYDIVFAAQEAGIAAARVGADFLEPHRAATAVLADGLHELGILDEEPAEALRRDRQTHRRWTLHGVSHMLGLDVHDCASAREEHYHGPLGPGYVLTVEPGLYFQPNDLSVPEEYRGIGVRIEDDILVSAEGPINLSAALPRASADVEAWMAERLAHPRDLGLGG